MVTAATSTDAYLKRNRLSRIDPSYGMSLSFKMGSGSAGAVGGKFPTEVQRAPISFGLELLASDPSPSGLVFSIGSGSAAVSFRLTSGNITVSAGALSGNGQATTTVNNEFVVGKRQRFTMVAFPSRGTVALYKGNVLVANQQAFNRRFTTWGGAGSIAFGSLSNVNLIGNEVEVFKKQFPKDYKFYPFVRSRRSGPAGAGLYEDVYEDVYE